MALRLEQARPGARRSRGANHERDSDRSDPRLLRSVHRPLRQHRHGGGRAFHAARSRPRASDRPGALRQGPSSAGAGLQQGAAHPALAPHPAKRRGRPRLGGDLMGRSARCDRSGDEAAGGDAWATERGVQPVVSFHYCNRRVCALSVSVDEGLRHAEPRLGAGHVRLGPRLRDALRVRRRERRHRRRWRGDGGHREQSAASSSGATIPPIRASRTRPRPSLRSSAE
jgi:hypothetical protein